MSFVQTGHDSKKPNIKAALNALNEVLNAGFLSIGNKKALQGLMQTEVQTGEDSDLKLKQPQASVKAYESHSGGIVEQIGDMKEKAEETLSGARNTEMKENHNFQMMEQSLTDAIKNSKDKLSNAKSSIASLTEETGKAKGELTETTKTKA